MPAALILSLVLIPVSAATPGEVAAASCNLAAPASAKVGSTVVIRGTGFPTNTTVAVSVTLEGGIPDQFTVGSDQDGAFTVTLTAELADVGRNTVDAGVDSICSARSVFTVIGPATASPSATPGPTATPRQTPAAPSASAAGSPAATPPRSDSGSSPAPRSTPPALALGLMILLLGGLGLVGGALARNPRT